MTANGQALFQLTRSADTLYKVMQPENVVDVLIPLLARAADVGEQRSCVTQPSFQRKRQAVVFCMSLLAADTCST